MNILLMISKNDRYGAQRVFIDQVSALHRMGHHVVVAGRGTQGYVADSVQAMGVEYHGIAMKSLKDLLFLRRLVKENKIDIIHTSLDRADYFGILASWLTRRPVVSTMNVKRYHIGYRFAHKVFVVSNKQKDLLIQKGIKPRKINMIRPGIEVERFKNPDLRKRGAWRQKLNIDNFTIVFCHVSSVIPQKAHAVSIEIAAECKKRGENPLLIIAGDPLRGDYYESLVKKIYDAGLERNVYFTGWTTELPELLSLSHFTLLPSVHEALGMVLIEGMAAGTPVIAREGEGGAELIEEYGTGFLYRPSDGVPGLAGKLIDLRRDEAKYGSLSRKCRQVAQEEFSLQRFGERLSSLYKSLRGEP